ncbi:MAG: type II secretion system F family protein [Chloroflexi bacterium]|nr:type II secretion system F family protein [Chloroflexota bacterium]
MELAPIGVALLCTISIVIMFAGVARYVFSSNAIGDRLDRFASRTGGSDTTPVQEKKGKLADEIDKELSRRGQSNDLIVQLARADLKLTPGEFLLISFALVAGVGLLFYLIFRQPFMALPGGVLGYFLPRVYLGFRQGQRRKAFASQLPDAVALLANSLRSGYSLLQSMELLSREMPPPIAGEFGRVVREMGLGLDMEAAMNNMVRRNANDDLDMTVTAILINHEVGGNLSQVLEIIGHTIRERIRIKGEIGVLTAQQQSAGYLVGSMPFILTMVLFVLNGDYMGELFRSICGMMLACTSFGLVGLAFVLIRRIVNIEV